MRREPEGGDYYPEDRLTRLAELDKRTQTLLERV